MITKICPKDLIGSIAVCRRGEIGLIKRIKTDKDGYIWLGTCLYKKARWQSRHPILIARSIDDYKLNKKEWDDIIREIQPK